MTLKARVLLVGLDPDIVDYSKSPVPGLTAAKVRAAVRPETPSCRVGMPLRRARASPPRSTDADAQAR